VSVVPADLTTVVLSRVSEAGFALAGVCAARASEREEAFRGWLASGGLGAMAYLREHVEARLDATRLVRGAKSVVVVGDVYWGRESGVGSRESGGDAERQSGDTDLPSPAMSGSGQGCPFPRAGEGLVARYARGVDYHEVMKGRLHGLCDALRAEHPGHVFRAFTDIEPVLEREHAARAGLGWIGKNTMLIHPRIGSYFFLGGIVTTLELAVPPPPPEGQRAVPDHCGTCTRCIDACPTGAITAYRVDASRCISALTIEQRGTIDPGLHAGMGAWVYGCDVCQEVCPHNSPRSEEVIGELARPNPAYAPARSGFDLLDVLGWTAQDRTARLRKSAMKRATLEMWKRNAVIAAGNLLRERDDPALRAAIEDLAWDAKEPAVVRETARQVLTSFTTEAQRAQRGDSGSPG